MGTLERIGHYIANTMIIVGVLGCGLLFIVMAVLCYMGYGN